MMVFSRVINFFNRVLYSGRGGRLFNYSLWRGAAN